MKRKKSNIILIGMAGCGKSTIGKMLAGSLSCGFVDTDKMIEKSQKRPLQEIIDSAGSIEFRRIEENLLLSLHVSNSVIATGGSSVYSRKGMEHLKKDGYVVLLDVDLPVLVKRVRNAATRGLVKQPDQSFSDLFHERRPLYLQFADFRFRCREMSREQVSMGLLDMLKKEGRMVIHI